MSIYIQQADQLKKLTGEKLTSSKIIAALGFTPSTFDGNYESLTNKPITNSDDDNTTLYVQDSSGNIIAMINENGLTTVDVNVDGTSVKTFISSVETEIGSLSTKAEKSYVDERFNSLTFADINGDPNLTDSDDSFSIADKNGYVIAYIDVNGLVTPAIKTSAIETTTITINGVDYVTAIEALEDAIGAVQGQANTNADNIQTNADNIQTNADDIDALQEIVTSDGLTYTATEFVIKDDLGNIALQLDDDALTVRYIKSDTTDAIKSQAESNAGAISGVATDLSDHTKDTDIHITAAERTSWNSKATPDYVNQQVAALVDGAPETLDTLNELAAALKDNANIVDVLNESISNKADKTTVEGIQKEVDDAESEIDALQQIVTEDGLNYTATEFIIKNDIGEIALQLDGEALTVRNIKSDTTDNIIKSVETLSGRVDPLEQATHTHSNKAILDNIDVAFTSTLKQQYDKAEENVIEEITIDKGTVTMDGTTAKITGVAAQGDFDTLSGVVQTKANSSDLEAVDDRLEAAEGEIDTLQGLIDDQGLTFNNDEFVIEDGSQNTLAKFDSSGLTVTAVNTKTLNATEIVSPTIEQIAGRLPSLEDASHTHGNKAILDKIDTEFTSALKAQYDKAEENVIESITISKGSVTMSGTTAQITGVAAQSDLEILQGVVQTKANSSDVVALGDRVETAEGEIDTLQGLIDEEGLTFNNDEFVIEDSEHNVLAKFDSSGLTVTTVNTETLNATEIVSPTIENIKGQITPLETASHTHGNKGVLDDITASYTVEEKSKLEGIQVGAEVNIIESITTNNSKVTVDMNGTTAQIKGVAAQSDLDSLSGEVENKVDKETGKGLSTNDYTTTEKSKLEGIQAGATKVENSTTNGNIKINDVETAVYSLPKATSSVLGGVKQGSNITIDDNGVISTHDPYKLPIATASQLGGVKQGDNVTIASDGTISVEKYTLPENVLTENDLVNDLESSSTTQPLSAAQGKALQERISGLALGEENVIEKIQVNSVDQTITNKTVNISIPTTTNDLTNNSGFITKDVNDLTNYYKKAETFTKGEVETLVSGVTIEVDSELSDTSTNPAQNKVVKAYIDSFASYAEQAYLLKDSIVNTLTSDSTTKPLSAAQGKALKTAIDSISGDIGDLGGGDMMKATYDSNNNGIVDNAEKLGGHSASDFILNSQGFDAGNVSGLISETRTTTGSTTANVIGYI